MRYKLILQYEVLNISINNDNMNQSIVCACFKKEPWQWTKTHLPYAGLNYTALSKIRQYICMTIVNKYWRSVCQCRVV